MTATKPQRTPPSGPGKGLVGILLVVLTAVAVVAIGFLLFQRWEATTVASAVDRSQANPALNPVKRLQLEYFLSTHADELTQPAGQGAERVTFTVNPGEGAAAIAASLAAAGLVGNKDLFVNYLVYYGLDGALVAGSHTVDPRATIPELAATLSGSGPRNLELNFLPGWRSEEMENYLRVTSPARIDPQAFSDIIQRRAPFDLAAYPLLANLPADTALEGYLFPGTYPITTETTSADLVGLMLTEFERQLAPDLRQLIGAQGLTVREAVILASIVEREALIADEKPIMASVFLNRLRTGMPLQADPTVQYALGFQPETQGWWKSPLALADLEIDSPYNTYRNTGLPPGPIANPSRRSLEAIANPATTDYLFFVLDCTAEQPGTHIFSVTYDEHLANVARCQ